LFDPTSEESEAGSNGSVARFDGTGWVIFEADEPPAEWAGILDRYRAMRMGDFVIGPDGTRWETSRNGIYRITFVAGGAGSTLEQRPTLYVLQYNADLVTIDCRNALSSRSGTHNVARAGL
jgi:hypothetical protein